MGIRDAVLSQQLQLDADLTLEKAKKKIRQREAVGEQSKELKGATEGDISLEAIRYRKQPKGRGPNPQRGRGGFKTENCAKQDVPLAVERARTLATNAPRRR